MPTVEHHGIILPRVGRQNPVQQQGGGNMISSIQIHGYRGFSNFEMSGLERVNLLVGANNSGKTSALEAVFILVSRGDPNSLWHVLWRRGERLAGGADRTNNRPPDLDVSHLFNGHKLELGSHFKLSAANQSPERSLTFTIGEIKPGKDDTNANARERIAVPTRLGLHVKGNPSPPIEVMPLSRAGGLDSDVLDSPRRIRRGRTDNEIPAHFITAESLDGSDLVSLWDKVALTENEERVLRALRFLDLDVERIAAQAGGQFYYPRGGFILKLKGYDHPVPIGSMGDGMWRMMAMAIAIAHCKDGILLIDEIDTGLHYKVMGNMWRLIFGAAKDLNVQVFATTHSSDCIRSLAELCYSETDATEHVTLQRVERGQPRAVPYTESEIEAAAESNIEVRG
jgi:predicted ATPase